MSLIEGLLEYAHIDEETLLQNIPGNQANEYFSSSKDAHSSILSYSRSLQNLQISENNSSRYGNFLVKTKAASRSGLHEEESFMINKFEELNQLKKIKLSRNQTAEKLAKRKKPHRESLPPIIPTGLLENRFFSEPQLPKTSESKPELMQFKPNEVFSTENSGKQEFVLGSTKYFKKKKN